MRDPANEPLLNGSCGGTGPPPPPSRLRVWHSATGVEECGDFERRCERLLDPEELQSADRYRRTTTRNQHIVGRAMARRLLGNAIDSAERIQFDAGEFGKPHVARPLQAKMPFNIAHTDGLVLCGVADSQVDVVGVDVEALGRRTSTELAERYFSPPEVAFLRAQPIEQQKYVFLRIWTLKEAFIKAIGTGLHTPLADFAFEGLDSDRPTIRFLRPQLRDHRDWRFECFEPREGFIAAAALAVEQPHLKITVDWPAFEDVL
jgi:4'-phosphopantetheinyl transferase